MIQTACRQERLWRLMDVRWEAPLSNLKREKEAMLFSYPEELRETIIEVSDATRPYIVPGTYASSPLQRRRALP